MLKNYKIQFISAQLSDKLAEEGTLTIMRNPEKISKKRQLTIYSLAVFLTVVLLGSMILIVRRSAYADQLLLNPSEVSLNENWTHTSIAALSVKETNFAESTLKDSQLEITFTEEELCQNDIRSITISGSGYVSKEGLSLDLFVDDEAYLKLDKQYDQSGVARDFSHTFNLKDSGLAWDCEDLKPLKVKVISRSSEGLDGEGNSWKLNNLEAKVDYQIKEADISFNSYIWQPIGSEQTNLLKNFDLPIVKKGSRVVLYSEIKNNSSFSSQPKQYSLQYAESENGICNIDNNWQDTNSETNLKLIFIENFVPDPSILIGENGYCQNENECPTTLLSSDQLNSYLSIDGSSSLIYPFIIDTTGSKPGDEYCLRVVERSGDDEEWTSVDSSISPKLNISAGKKLNLFKELKLKNELSFKIENKDFSADEYIDFEAQLLDQTTSGDIYFDGVVQNSGVLDVEQFEISSQIADDRGFPIDVPIDLTLSGDGLIRATVPPMKEIKPGEYTITLRVDDRAENTSKSIEQDFSWGVIAINTDKDIYLQGEDAQIMMTVLDDTGSTVCDADIMVDLFSPSGAKSSYSTSEGTVKISDECGPNSFTYKPDFSFSKNVGPEQGEYIIRLTATIPNGTRISEQTFLVQEQPRFQIIRKSVTRIYPLRDYDMVIEIKANEDYRGIISDFIPLSFEVKESDGSVTSHIDHKRIDWEVDMKTGETKSLGYTFDAPDISPEYYTLGPILIGSYQEARIWQIASDALVSKYAATCTVWTNTAGGTGAPTLASTAGYTSFTTTNSAYATVSARRTMNCNGFNNASLGTFNSAQVMYSMAANGAAGGNDTTTVSYSVNGGAYNTLATYTHSVQRSNATNGGYWTHNAPNITSWTDIGNTVVRFANARTAGADNRLIYVDAVWVEVTYTPNTITMSGTCKDFDQTTNCSTTDSVRFAINGVLQAQTGTVSAGTWTITGVNQPLAGAILTVYLDGVTDANEANAIVKYDGTGNITGVELIREHLSIGSDDNQTISNSEIALYDNGTSGDEDIFFEVDASNNLVLDNVSQSTQEEIYVKGSNIYQPSAVSTVTTSTHDLENIGTLTLNNNNLNLSGSWRNSGTLTAGTSTVILSAQSGSESINNTGGTGGFNNLTLGQTSGTATWSASSALDVNGNMIIDYGTLSPGTNNVTLAGNLTVNSSGNYTIGSGLFTFDGSATQTWTDNTTNKIDMGSVRLGGASHTLQLGSTVKSTNIIIPTTYTLNLGSNGYSYILTGSGTGTSRPFYINGGTFTPGTNSTMIFRGTGATEIQATTYDNLYLEGSASSTYTLGTTTSQSITADNVNVGDGSGTFTLNAETHDPVFNVGGNFSILANATYSASSTSLLNIGGNYSNNGMFTSNSGEVNFNATATGRTLSGSMTGSNDFNKLTFNGAGGGWTSNDPISVTADTLPTMSVLQGTLTIGNGDGDDLTVLEQLLVGGASGVSTLQTAAIAQGNEIEINSNTPTPSVCTNCKVTVGTTTDGNPTGSLIINENGVLRLNSETDGENGVEVEASGHFQVLGNLDDTGTTTTNSSDTTIYDTSKSWSANTHQGKHIQMTSGLAEGEIFSINSNLTSSLSITDQFTQTDTSGSYNSGTHTFTSSATFITSNDQTVGQYLFNQTQNRYSRIVDTIDGGSTDQLVVVDSPDVFQYTNGDTVTVVTGIRSGDTYSIIDYAYVTGGTGAACNADQISTFHGYVNGKQNSETTMNYANACDLGILTSGKRGLEFTSINESDANEGANISNSYLHHNLTGIYFDSTTGVNLNSNTIDQNQNGVVLASSSGNRLTGNHISRSTAEGILLLTSGNHRNSIDLNHIYASPTGIKVEGSSANRIFSNEVSAGTYGLHLASSSNENFIYSNQIYGRSTYAIFLESVSAQRFHSNSIFGTGSGIYLTSSLNNISLSDNYGVTQSNLYDIEMNSGSTSTLFCYGCNMASTTEYNGVTATGSYIISEDHDPSSQSGLTKIIGEYTIPDNVAETVSFNEGLQQFNYSNPLWGSASSNAVYVGSGSEDADIQITLNSTINNIEIYYATVTSGAGTDTPTFTITRTNGAASPATYTLPSTYTEASTGVSFTIQDGVTNYQLGDTYMFMVFPSSADSNVVKSIEVAQSGDSFAVDTGETLELKGSPTNESTVTGPTGGFAFQVSGTFDASDYYLSRTDASGLNFLTGATILSLDNGFFDDSEGAGSTDTYITVDSSILNTGAQSFTAVAFDLTPSDANAEYNVTLIGTPSACTNTWTFNNSPGLKATESWDSESGDGGPCNTGQGYILFASTSNNPPNIPTNLSQKTTTDVPVVQADWINSTTVKFTASATDPDVSDTLQLCIEIDLLGTAFSGTENSCGTGVPYSGVAIEISHTISGLVSGSQYHWQARVRDQNTNNSAWVSFGTNLETERDIGIDTSAPTTGSVFDGEVYLTDADENDGSLDRIYGSWSGYADAQSGIKEYEYALGTTSGGTEVVNWTSNSNPGDLFADGFETGNFTNWDATVTDGGNLAPSITQVHTGIYSAAALMNDVNPLVLQDDYTSSSEIYTRFYIHMNGRTPGNNTSMTALSLQSGGTQRAGIEIGRTGGTTFVRARENVGNTTTVNVTMPINQWVAIELHWKAGSSEPVTMWIDGTAYTTTNANTTGLTVNQSKLGYISGSNMNTTYYFDDFSSDTQYRQGPIGYLSKEVIATNHLRTGKLYHLSIRAVNNAESPSTGVSSDGISVLPTFSFVLNKSSISFLNLNINNSWSDTQTVQSTASTNAYNGYVARIYASQLLTNQLNNSYTIPMYPSSASTPTTWSGSGFGYSTNDPNLSGGTADRYTNGGPNFSGLTTVAPGTPAVDHTATISGTTGIVSDQQFTITLKVATPASQAAGPYTTKLIFIATPNF